MASDRAEGKVEDRVEGKGGHGAGPASRRAPVGERPGSERFRTLPEPIRLEDMVAVQVVSPPADPTMGRDPERDFMLRNAGG
jgi:hypothetical protein